MRLVSSLTAKVGAYADGANAMTKCIGTADCFIEFISNILFREDYRHFILVFFKEFFSQAKVQ